MATKEKKQVYTNKQYKLTRDVAPLSFMIPTKNTRSNPLLWFDENTGQNRELRYARNQKSPFVDEQDGNVILEPIIFEDGFLYVPKENQVLQQFLHYHPMNGRKFVEVDEAKDASEQVENIMLEADALLEAKNLSVDQLENVCRVLFNTDVTKMSTAELKRDVLVFAKRYPSDFLDVVSDPELKMTATIQKFFSEGLLTFRKSGKEVWFNTKANKTKLMNIPFGKDGMDLVVSYMKSDEGIEHLKYLEDLLD